MIETLLGSLFGGVFRIIPEAMNLFDKFNERKHEILMLEKTIEADKLRGEMVLSQADLEKSYDALIEGVKAQSVISGVRWVDGLNSFIRPLLTIWWCVVLYTGYLVCAFFSLKEEGLTSVESFSTLWTASEKAIVASIISFWFVDRSLRKK